MDELRGQVTGVEKGREERGRGRNGAKPTESGSDGDGPKSPKWRKQPRLEVASRAEKRREAAEMAERSRDSEARAGERQEMGKSATVRRGVRREPAERMRRRRRKAPSCCPCAAPPPALHRPDSH
ncbi:Hypothetical predicted protein [Marmota monax]|uniref:Uncharacterized protein n=1 Tax=Marmota monax TaxID=9995 RepID=A0A5E4CIF2_MARMO|nr:Hypothetical predicted protein [Marmota monax]